MQNNTQESWEEEFDKKWIDDDFDGITITVSREKIKAFIHALLQKQAEEISEAVEGLKKKVIPNMLQEDDIFNEKGIDGVMGYNSALKDVLDLLAIKQVINK